MDRLDIRNYLYHGISNGVYKGSASDELLAIFESILKDEHLICGKELNKRDVYSVITYYDGHSWSPRISLGFFPFNDKIYNISRSTSISKNNMPESLIELLKTEYNIYEETFNMRQNIKMHYGEEFAWKDYYETITLIFDPKLLDELKIANYAVLHDEICIDEYVPLRKYLVAVSIDTTTCPLEDDYGLVDGFEYQYLNLGKKYYYAVKKLLKKYGYDVPVIDFLSGKSLDEQGEVLVRVNRKNKMY